MPGGKSASCLAVQVTARGTTMRVWLTDDTRRLPAQLEIPLPFGSVTLPLAGQREAGRRGSRAHRCCLRTDLTTCRLPLPRFPLPCFPASPLPRLVPPQIVIDLPAADLQVVLQHLVPLGLQESLRQVLAQGRFDHIVLLEHLQRLVQVAG